MNRYARARGIRLRFGGYGASYGMAYQGGPIYEDAPYLGKVFENRERYPDGPTYGAWGFPGSTPRKESMPRLLGAAGRTTN